MTLRVQRAKLSQSTSFICSDGASFCQRTSIGLLGWSQRHQAPATNLLTSLDLLSFCQQISDTAAGWFQGHHAPATNMFKSLDLIGFCKLNCAPATECPQGHHAPATNMFTNLDIIGSCKQVSATFAHIGPDCFSTRHIASRRFTVV
jgi:hypothetical protein